MLPETFGKPCCGRVAPSALISKCKWQLREGAPTGSQQPAVCARLSLCPLWASFSPLALLGALRVTQEAAEDGGASNPHGRILFEVCSLGPPALPALRGGGSTTIVCLFF